MESNDFSTNGGPPPTHPPPPHHGYHDGSYPSYPPPNDAGYPGYMNYSNYANYPPPTGPNDYPPPPPHTAYQDPYQHHQYQQHDPYYAPPPPEPIKAPEPAPYHHHHHHHHHHQQHQQHQHLPPPPHVHQPPPPAPEEPKQHEHHETPKDDVVVQTEPASVPTPPIPAIPAALPEQHQVEQQQQHQQHHVPTVAVDQPKIEEPVQEQVVAAPDTTATTEKSTTPAPPAEALPEGPIFSFNDTLSELNAFRNQHGNAGIPLAHPAFARIADALIANGFEDELNKRWEDKFELLKAYKEKNGDCDVPFTDCTLGQWMNDQRKMYAEKKSDPLSQSRIEKLTALGFEWDLSKWDKRLQELIEFKKEKGHVDVPINHPGLGIWVINQRFNIHEMSKERVEALDALGFIWNHNRKRRSDEAWNKRYAELLDFIKVNNHPNVPTTAGHSKLSKWVGKQREEYKKFTNKQSSQLCKSRIDRLNAIGFQWSLQAWKVIPWDERFEELKKFKAQHGHCKIPRNHPYFGNWPMWQRAQYKLYKEGKQSKITKEKVDKLISIGFLKADAPAPAPAPLPPVDANPVPEHHSMYENYEPAPVWN